MKVNLNLPTPITFLEEINQNKVYVKRDDLSGIGFGGNKMRKMQYFIKDAIKNESDCIVTYGDVQSNHCRSAASIARLFNMEIYLIHPEVEKNSAKVNGNALINNIYEPEIVFTQLNNVSHTIKRVLKQLKEEGKSPYFIQGGGHGNLGTHAYKKAYDEILEQEKSLSVEFDYIFHASGTGTTQAGLIAGNILSNKSKEIIGISIAREQERGEDVIKSSLIDYLPNEYHNEINSQLNFNTKYRGNGYADISKDVTETIKRLIYEHSLFLDPVYTGKAYNGMLNYLTEKNIKNKKILFIHTGGVPLFFNYAEKFIED